MEGGAVNHHRARRRPTSVRAPVPACQAPNASRMALRLSSVSVTDVIVMVRPRSCHKRWPLEILVAPTDQPALHTDRTAGPQRRICGPSEVGVRSARSDVCQASRICALSAVRRSSWPTDGRTARQRESVHRAITIAAEVVETEIRDGMFSDTGRASWFAHRLGSARMMVVTGLGPWSLSDDRSVSYGAVAATGLCVVVGDSPCR